MRFRDVIVYVDGTEASAARDAFAISLAKSSGAHLLAIAFAPKALMPLYGADVALADLSGVLDGVREQGEQALARFRTLAKDEGISCESRLISGTSDEFPHDFASAARQTDLAILGQPRDGDPLIGQYALLERCLFASGRPVLIVPADPVLPPSLDTIAVAWDGSAEAARALNDALSFLKEARRVILLAGASEAAVREPENTLEGMIAHLKRHDVEAEPLKVQMDEGEDVGRFLLARASDLQADMIVMGAFHHSRWREFIIGGVTLTMLEEAKLPLFMAH